MSKGEKVMQDEIGKKKRMSDGWAEEWGSLGEENKNSSSRKDNGIPK